MVILQFRQSYPEDMFLIPAIFIALFIWGLGLIVALIVGIKRPKIKFLSITESETPVESPAQSKFYMHLGDHEIEVAPEEVKSLRRQSYTILER